MRRPLVLLLAVALLLLTPATAVADVDPAGSWPLRPRPEVVEGFDPPGSAWGPGHRGVDLVGAVGQQVHSALGGRVSFAGTIAGKAVVVVDHGPTRTTYEPVSTSLSSGDRVVKGQPIGTLVLPGSHCFPTACLHWGWIEGDTYLDPLRLVGAGPVRLLPLQGLPTTPTATATPTFGPWRPVLTPYADWLPLLRLLHPRVEP